MRRVPSSPPVCHTLLVCTVLRSMEGALEKSAISRNRYAFRILNCFNSFAIFPCIPSSRSR